MSSTCRFFALLTACLSEVGLAAADEPKLEIFVLRDRVPRIEPEDKIETFTCVAMSGDGKWVAAGTTHNSVILWEAATGKIVQEFSDHEAPIHRLALSDDGKRLVTGSDDGQIIEWGTRPAHRIRTIGSYNFPPCALAFSSDGQKILTASTSGPVVVWNAETGLVWKSISAQKGGVVKAWMGEGGRSVLTEDDQTITLWDMTSGAKLNTYQIPRFGESRHVDMSLDGKIVLFHGEPGRGNWDAITGGKLSGAWRLENTTKIDINDKFCREVVVFRASFLPGKAKSSGSRFALAEGSSTVSASRNAENLAVIGLYSSTVGLLRGDTQTELQLPRKRTERAGADVLASVSLADAGKRLTISTASGALWDSSTGNVKTTGRSFPREAKLISYSADRLRALSVADKKTAAVTEPKSIKPLLTIPGHGSRISAVGLSPDGRKAFVGYWDRTAQIWDVDSGKMVRTLPDLAASDVAALSDDGKRLLTICTDDTARLWDIPMGKELARFYSFSSGKDWLVTTPDGYFDGSEGGRRFVNLRIGGTLTLAPAPRTREFYRPGLANKILHGEPIKP